MKSPYVAAVDIGNSGARVALLRGMHVLGSRRLEQGSAGAIRKSLRELLEEAGTARVDGAVISSVVPRQTAAFRVGLARAAGRAPLVVTAGVRTGLRMRYRTPETLGSDRLCAAAAAYARYGGPVIVADLGTATTIDCITRGGEYLGGSIGPGIGTSARALHAAAAQLPLIDLVAPASAVGTDTRSALQSGIVFGAIGGVEGLVAKLRRITGKRTIVVATGGYAALVAARSPAIDIVNPYLVLQGAALIWQRQKRTG